MTSPKRRTTWDHINRRSWLLWTVTFAVVLALTATVPLLYLPLLQASSDGRDVTTANAYMVITGLAGLVVIFCLYTILKQHELNTTRQKLVREEREREDVGTRLSELSALFQVSTTLNLQLKLDVILEIIVRRVVSTLRAQQASIMIYNPEDGVLQTRASYGLESEFARNARKRLGEGIAGWVAEQQEAVLLNDKREDGAAPEPFQKHYKANRNITSALSLPLVVGERCVGVMNVNRINHPNPFQDHHRDMLKLFSDHVGAVIDRAESMERLGVRTRQLEADNQKLSETNRLKDVFLSTASHELKTPLTSVIAYAELLDDNENRLDGEQRTEFLRRLRGEAERLLGLIEDILDVSRIESGKLALRRVQISLLDVVRTAVETTRAMAMKSNIEIAESYPHEVPEMAIDEVKLRQVVVNLLVNAIKFSPERSTVKVSVIREDDCARVEVSDSGPGIRPEDATHIFELFGQGMNEARRKDGLGIGLHLVKRITELHGGHVGVNSRPGEGSTFWLRLPLSLVRPAETAEVESQVA